MHTNSEYVLHNNDLNCNTFNHHQLQPQINHIFDVDQFLTFQQISNKSEGQKNEIEQEYHNYKEQSSCCSQLDKTPCKKKSIFHNHQKHLVSTLRQEFRVPKEQFAGVGYLPYKIWQKFRSSPIITKNILHIVFGVQNNYSCRVDTNFLQRTGFLKIYQNNSYEKIKNTQEFLRKFIVDKSNSLNIYKIIKRRKIQKLECFEGYFRQFIQQLNNGPIKRRLPKKNNIKNLIAQSSLP